MTDRLPALAPRIVLRALERAGFAVHPGTGGHLILKHPDHPTLRVTLPMHGKDLKRKTLATVIKQAGLTTAEFLELL